jgi:hypothetical protein
VPGAGAYGIDTRDAGADSWTGRYLFFARSPEEARSRVRDAGFHSKQIRARWAPGQEPPEGVPAGMGPGDEHWYRSRWDDNGWTAWERLPGDYRHPPQGRAAGDPSLR